MRHSAAVLLRHLDLEAVELELIGLDQTGLGEPVTDFVPLVTLQLQYLSILGVLYHGAVAGKLLKEGLVEVSNHMALVPENKTDT